MRPTRSSAVARLVACICALRPRPSLAYGDRRSPGRPAPAYRSRGSTTTTRAATSADASAFTLDSVRASLIRQEETIIYSLIERTQFAVNGEVYDKRGATFAEGDIADALKSNPAGCSFLDMMLYETEQCHARARRYLSPEEYPFFPGDVAPPALPPLAYPEIIRDDGQNINDQILAAYLDFVVPRGCAPGDDGQHGSTAIADIACLQALSRRVHFGKFVAESKFAADADAFRDLAARGDVPGIHALLENVAVEDNVVRRAMLKAVTFGQDAFSGMDPGYKVEPTLVASIYRNMIIPLTKQVQVTYLLERLGHGDKVPKQPDDWPPYLRAFARADTDPTTFLGY